MSRREVGRVALGVKSLKKPRSETESPNWHSFPLVGDGEIDGAFVAYSNDCFLQGVHYHHGSHLLAAVTDRRPSCSRFVSVQFPRLCTDALKDGDSSRRRDSSSRAMPAPVWEGMAAQLTFHKQLHSGLRPQPIGDHGSFCHSFRHKDRSPRWSVLMDQR